MASLRPANVGILAMDIYFPPTCVTQVSICGFSHKALIFILSFLLCFVFCFVKLRFLFLVWLCCVFCFDGLCRMLWRVMMGWAKGNILLGLDRIAWPSALRLKMLSQWGWLQFCISNKHFLTIVFIYLLLFSSLLIGTFGLEFLQFWSPKFFFKTN